MTHDPDVSACFIPPSPRRLADLDLVAEARAVAETLLTAADALEAGDDAAARAILEDALRRR